MWRKLRSRNKFVGNKKILYKTLFLAFDVTYFCIFFITLLFHFEITVFSIRYIISYSDIRSYFEIGLVASMLFAECPTYTTVFFQNLIIFTLFKYWFFSPLLLPTDYKLHIQGIFFSRKKGDHTRQTEKTQGKEKEEKKTAPKILSDLVQ